MPSSAATNACSSSWETSLTRCDHRRPRHGQTGGSISTATAAVCLPTTVDAVDEIRWGVVGPGRIAQSVMGDFAHVAGARPVAVASRSLDRARAFAREHGLQRAHGSYADIAPDPDADALYPATPHPPPARARH